MTHFAFMSTSDAGTCVLPLRNDAIGDEAIALWGVIEAEGFALGCANKPLPKPFYEFELNGSTRRVFTLSSFGLESHHFFAGYWAGRKARAKLSNKPEDERGSGRVTRRR